MFGWMFNGKFNKNEICMVFLVGFFICKEKVIVGVVDDLELCGFNGEIVKRFSLRLLKGWLFIVNLEIGKELEYFMELIFI